MVNILLARRATPPAPPAPAREIRLMSWTGWDGSQWTLSNPTAKIAMLPGVEGLHEPRIQRYLEQSSAVPGHRIRGSRALAREVFWPMLFQARSEEEWRDRYSAFFDSIDVERPGIWTVGDGPTKRTLRLTGVFEGGVAFDIDPFVTGWVSIGVPLEAAQPYWEGEPVLGGPWQASAGSSFFPGPPFTLSSVRRTPERAQITNPGQVATYPTWVLSGPLDADSQVGISGRIVTVPFAILAGKTLVIQTDPRLQYATLIDSPPLGVPIDFANLGGVDKTKELGFQPFAPIPPGSKVTLSVSIEGTGSAACRIVPLYRRAS